MFEPVVRSTVDWQRFATEDWDHQPVVFRQVADPPFAEPDVFAAAVAAGPDGAPPTCQFTVERHQQTDPAPFLPTAADLTFDGYEKRIATQLGGRRYALLINALHSFHRPVWHREQQFFAGLWDQVGLPLTGAITTLFHGTYEHSPVGVHQDRFATFMVGLRGRKRMRFWAQRPWDEPVSTVLDYREYLATSFAVEIEPGDILYWPDTYYHVGESAGDEPATSVNVGIPRTEHKVAYELDALEAFQPPAGAMVWPGGDDDGLLSSELPAVLMESVEAYRQLDLPSWARQVSERKWAAGGFEPVPGTDR